MVNALTRMVRPYLPFFMATPAFAWQILFFYIPVAFVIYLSFTVPQTGAHSLQAYAHLINLSVTAVLFRSILLALITATICLFIAYPVAYFISVRLTRYKGICLFFLLLPFWTNFLVQVYSWFFILERHGLINKFLMACGIISEPITLLNTPFAVYLVMFYYYLPFMILPIYTNLEKLNMQLLEASMDLGANAWQTFLRVTLPLSVPGMRTGFFLVLIPAFGEFVIPALLGGAKQLYLGSLISHYFLVARDTQLGAALTCISIVVLMLLVVLVNHVFKRYMTSEK